MILETETQNQSATVKIFDLEKGLFFLAKSIWETPEALSVLQSAQKIIQARLGRSLDAAIQNIVKHGASVERQTELVRDLTRSELKLAVDEINEAVRALQADDEPHISMAKLVELPNGTQRLFFFMSGERSLTVFRKQKKNLLKETESFGEMRVEPGDRLEIANETGERDTFVFTVQTHGPDRSYVNRISLSISQIKLDEWKNDLPRLEQQAMRLHTYLQEKSLGLDSQKVLEHRIALNRLEQEIVRRRFWLQNRSEFARKRYEQLIEEQKGLQLDKLN